MLTNKGKAMNSISDRRSFDNTNEKSPPSKSVVPLETDVLCGRGNAHSNREGNKAFSEICRDNLRQYIAAPTRTEKIRVVSSVLEQVLATGARFVKMDRSTKSWYQASKKEAHDKTGHAMRDMIRISTIENREKDSATVTAISSGTKQSKFSMAIKNQAEHRRPFTVKSISFDKFDKDFSCGDKIGGSSSTPIFGSLIYSRVLKTMLDEEKEISHNISTDEDSICSCPSLRDNDKVPCLPPLNHTGFDQIIGIADANQRHQTGQALDLPYPLLADTFFEDST